MDDLQQVFSLLPGDYNTTVVTIGSALLGAGCGVIGTFMTLRKRILLSDAVSHATLPGIAIGFLVALSLLGDGRSLPVLMLGAAAAGAAGIVAVQLIRDHTRLSEDTAIATVLSVGFGLGVVLLSHIQTLPVAGQAGLGNFLLGQAAGLLADEAMGIAAAAVVVTLVTALLAKEFAVVCFDRDFAAAQGWPIRRLDLLMTALMLAMVCIGLKTVGLVLIVALLVIPPAAARYWSDRLAVNLILAAAIGAVSCATGAALSSVADDLPTGAVIVLVAAALFLASLLAAPGRGLVAVLIERRRLGRRLLSPSPS